MNEFKTPIYNRKSSAAYVERLKAKGWVKLQIYIPPEIKSQLMELKEQLLESYRATQAEGGK